jgi:phosphatidate cytidylyltransferase
VATLTAAVIATAASALRGPQDALVLAMVGAFAVSILARMLGAPRPAWLGVGVLVAAVPCGLLIWLRLGGAEGGEWGRVTVLWLLAAVWATDIGAYVAGRTIGGPKLWPAVSPNKTWAGLVGGAAAAGAAGVATAWLVEPVQPGFLGPFSAALAVVAQGGDLAESAVKRRFGVKDSGRLIPGHGGLYDRVDGLIAAIVLVAACNAVAGRSVLLWP